MFNIFRKRTAKEFLEEAKETYIVPKKEQPKKEDPPKVYYRIGVTENNRVAFSMGYSEITMNRQGCQQMIDQITCFMNQLNEEESPKKETTND